MSTTITKSLKFPWGGKQPVAMHGKENGGYASTPGAKKTFQVKATSVGLAERHPNTGTPPPRLRRNTSVSKSLRDAVGTIRQRLRKSTRRRKRLEDHGNGSPVTPGFNRKGRRTPPRRMKGGYREVKMYSPFGVDTPKSMKPMLHKNAPRWHDVETPTRLRKEVEDLTANMQALVNLTPGTLMTRAQSKRRLSAQAGSTSSGGLTALTGSQSAEVTQVRHQVRRKIQTVV